MPKMVTILLVDNDASYRDSLRTFLDSENYKVLTASNLHKARRALQRRNVDLAIIDIRLTNDNDEEDASGLELAREHPEVPRIILTGFPTYSHVRAALASVVDKPSLALDFVDKSDGPQAVKDSIERVLAYVERKEQWFILKQWLPGISLLMLLLAVAFTVIAIVDHNPWWLAGAILWSTLFALFASLSKLDIGSTNKN
jgi:DNA-binding NtrC family response regulator